MEENKSKTKSEMILLSTLEEGWKNNGYFFNERLSYKFCTLMNTCISLGLPALKWKKEDGSTAVITIANAKTMALDMMQRLGELHKL